nr:hypothetical protein [Flavobacterium kingsejongi]
MDVVTELCITSSEVTVTVFVNVLKALELTIPCTIIVSAVAGLPSAGIFPEVVTVLVVPDNAPLMVAPPPAVILQSDTVTDVGTLSSISALKISPAPPLDTTIV